MRATISFDVNVERVEDTMCILVGQESGALRTAANILERSDGATILEEVTEALDLLEDSVSQLRQYKDMVISFQRARLETVLPQPAEEPLPQSPMSGFSSMSPDFQEEMRNFSDFVEKISATAESTEEEPDEQPEEG